MSGARKHRSMEERIAAAVRYRGKAEALFRIEPLDHRFYSRARHRRWPCGGEARRCPAKASMPRLRREIVIIEAPPPWRAPVMVSAHMCSVLGCWRELSCEPGRLECPENRRAPLPGQGPLCPPRCTESDTFRDTRTTRGSASLMARVGAMLASVRGAVWRGNSAA
jgi:hypothetical protein